MARPDLKFQVGWDAADYIPLAQGIQHGCGFARYTNGRCGNPDMSRPPGYPFFVAMMPGLRSVLVIQAVLGSMLCVWLGWFVMKRWGFAAGILAEILLATDIPSIVYGGMIMSEECFQFLIAGGVLLGLSAIDGEEWSRTSLIKGFAAAAMYTAAAMLRPPGVFLVLFAPLPFLLASGITWRRAIGFGLVAFMLPVSAVLGWTARNERIGYTTFCTDSSYTAYFYNAAGVLAYADHRPFNAVSAELARKVNLPANHTDIALGIEREMMARTLQIYLAHPLPAALVTVRGLALVALVPDRNELNEMIGANGAGPFGLPPSYDLAERLRNTLRSPLLVTLIAVQLIVMVFVWLGVARAFMHAHWHSKRAAAFIAIPAAMALVMLMCAASPDAHARFRVPAMPFLAMLAGIGAAASRSGQGGTLR